MFRHETFVLLATAGAVLHFCPKGGKCMQKFKMAHILDVQN
jgi:hypothetical protein